MNDPKLVPLGPGVYSLFLKSGKRLLSLAGYFPDPQLPSWDYGAWRNLYIGESYGLRGRILDHLTGGLEDSPLRESIMATHWFAASGDLGDLKNRQLTEEALTEWLRHDVVIGYKECGYHKTVEREMLKRTAAPFNIGDRAPTQFSRLLAQLRSRFRESVVSGWEPPPPKVRPRRRR